MTYIPQVPLWGEKYLDNNKQTLVEYHQWLCTTGIKKGLISQKSDQFIWDEFIVHSLYFYKIIEDLGVKNKNIFDLGTGGGIPGMPVSIVSQKNVTLIDNKKSRIFELERLIKILKIENVIAEEKNAIDIINNEDNAVFTLRCFISSSKLLKEALKRTTKNTYLVSSKEGNGELINEKFHVKQERFLINKSDYRFIDVITSM